jgi:hypothetical protein
MTEAITWRTSRRSSASNCQTGSHVVPEARQRAGPDPLVDRLRLRTHVEELRDPMDVPAFSDLGAPVHPGHRGSGSSPPKFAQLLIASSGRVLIQVVLGEECTAEAVGIGPRALAKTSM